MVKSLMILILPSFASFTHHMEIHYTPAFPQGCGFGLLGNRIVREDTLGPIGRMPSQHAYEALATRVVKQVYYMLEAELGLKRLDLNGVPIWVTPGTLTDRTRPLLVIMQGMNPVRPGIWSRAVCINENLDDGTVKPLVVAAHAAGYNVLIANPNQTCREDEFLANNEPLPMSNPYNLGTLFDGSPIPSDLLVPTNRDPGRHAVTLWQRVLRPCPAPRIDIVCFSYGGVATLEMLKVVFSEDMGDKIGRVAFLDSVHSAPAGGAVGTFLMSRSARAWMATETPEMHIGAGLNRRVVAEVFGAHSSDHNHVPPTTWPDALAWLCDGHDLGAKPAKAENQM